MALGGRRRRPPPPPGENFYDVVNAAVNDFAEHGYDSDERLQFWINKIRAAAERDLTPPDVLQRELSKVLTQTYDRFMKSGAIEDLHFNVSRYTRDMLKPKLHSELDRRIMASANLIVLNRDEAINDTIRRFAGWASSVPPGGSKSTDKSKREEKRKIKSSLKQCSFRERRVIIDQGHKLVSSINEIVAVDQGAIAAVWSSRWKQRGYNYREDHKERDQKIWVIQDGWAYKKGYITKGEGFITDITRPGEEVYCLPGNTEIEFADGVEKAYRRWYVGELTTVITSSGKTLRLTPNHPILTRSGMVAAGALNESDDIAEIADEAYKFSKSHDHNRPCVIADIFQSCKIGGFTEMVVGSEGDFHGDGFIDENVNVVSPARPLVIDSLTSRFKRTQNLFFACTNHFTARLRAFNESFFGLFRSPYGFMCALGKRCASIFANPLMPNEHSFAGASDFNSKISKLPIDRFGSASPIDRKSFCANSGEISLNDIGPEDGVNLLNRLPFKHQFTKALSVRTEQWAGHVYNLQTRGGYYTSNGIITSNCRCSYRYVFSTDKLPDEMITAKGRKALEETREKMRAIRKTSVEAA